MNKKLHLPFFVLTIFVAGLGSGLGVANLVVKYKVANTSNIKTIGVGVFWDHDCFVQVNTIDWGTLEPRTSATKLVYVRSESNILLTLTIFAENWSPSKASDFIAFQTPSKLLLQPKIIENVSITQIKQQMIIV